VSGADFTEKATSKRDLAAAQAAFTLPYTHASRICAISIATIPMPKRFSKT